jgi:hypothetical protein
VAFLCSPTVILWPIRTGEVSAEREPLPASDGCSQITAGLCRAAQLVELSNLQRELTTSFS